MADAFSLLSDIFKLKPVREYTLFEKKTHRVLMASDASYEAGVGKAGLLIRSDPGKPRRNVWAWWSTSTPSDR